MSIGKAFKAFFDELFGKKEPVALPTPEVVEQPDKFAAGAVFTLNLLQREGRLVDFLMEDVSAFSDAQIGMAVRQIHENSAGCIKKYFSPEKVITEQENSDYSVPADYDVTTLRVTGNVKNGVAQIGKIQHGGWKVGSLQLPKVVGALNTTVIAPGEVEV